MPMQRASAEGEYYAQLVGRVLARQTRQLLVAIALVAMATGASGHTGERVAALKDHSVDT